MEQDQKNLEDRMEGSCPFVKEKISMYHGIYLLAGDDEVSYGCGLDGGIAAGGRKRTSIPGGASTPCSLEYAKTCPSYLKQKA